MAANPASLPLEPRQESEDPCPSDSACGLLQRYLRHCRAQKLSTIATSGLLLAAFCCYLAITFMALSCYYIEGSALQARLAQMDLIARRWRWLVIIASATGALSFSQHLLISRVKSKIGSISLLERCRVPSHLLVTLQLLTETLARPRLVMVAEVLVALYGFAVAIIFISWILNCGTPDWNPIQMAMSMLVLIAPAVPIILGFWAVRCQATQNEELRERLGLLSKS